MNSKTSIIDGRECFISDSVQPQYILVQTLGNHERGIFDRTAERIADACFFCLRKIYLPIIPTQRKIFLTVLPVQRRFWELWLNENAKADMSATLPERFEGRTFAPHQRCRP